MADSTAKWTCCTSPDGYHHAQDCKQFWPGGLMRSTYGERKLEILDERCKHGIEKDPKLDEALQVGDGEYGAYLPSAERLRFSQGFILGWQACVKAFAERFGV